MVISDATGETAERMVRAALLQYGDVQTNLRVYSRVRLEEEMERIVERAAELNALVVFTVVNSQARDLFWKLVERYDVEAVDLIGQLIAKLSSWLGAQPSGVPGLLHTLSEEYFRRIEAVEFAVKNDDGAEPRNLPKADLVLVGISRTSKTPLSTFLAQKGLRVANVPLVLGVDPPAELEKVPDERIYGLIISPDSLVRIRRARLEHLGMPSDSSYGAREHVEHEIEYSREIFRRHPNWPVIDVTGKAIEETAADIMRLYKERMNQ